MRRLSILLAAIGFAVLALTVSGPAAAQDRYSAIVLDAANGDVLYEDQADAPRYPASLAKMMTLYLLFDAIRHGDIGADEVLTASAAAAAQPSTHLALQAGDRISVEDAILALVVWSANDVATIVAERLAGSETRFAALMNARARYLGLNSTRFTNATGLPDAAQSTTARDMARLGRALWTDFPDYYSYFQTADFSWNAVRVRNHNHLLRAVDGVDGIKTGYTRASGFNIVSSAYRNGGRVIVVVMGGNSAAGRDAQAANLIDVAFAEYARRATMGAANASVVAASQGTR